MVSAIGQALRDTLRVISGWRLVLILALILAFTFVGQTFLCQPDPALLKADPALYTKIYGSDQPLGGRCIPYCIFFGLVCVATGLLVGVGMRTLAILRFRANHPGRHSGS